MPPTTPSPVLLSLPTGLDLGGVTTWAVNLANGLIRRGRQVALIVHPIPPNHIGAQITLDPRIQLISLPPTVPSLHAAAGDLSPFIPTYRDTVERLAAIARTPVIYFPNILGDSYALGAALCTTHPEQARMVAWQHTDSDYDTALFVRYAPVISRMIAINDSMITTVRERSRGLIKNIQTVPHGVEIPSSPPPIRPPLQGRPLQLLYAGRIEHRQKRIGALAFLSQELTRRSIPHRLLVVGDGPATPDFARQIAQIPSIERIPSVNSDQLAAYYQAADAFILPSRYEGLCIARIEAAAHGCIPIVTTHNSGAGTGLQNGVSAIFIDADSDDDESTAGLRAADAIQKFLQSDLQSMSLAAWNAAKTSFSMTKHLDELERAIDAAAASPPQFWPTSIPVAFSSSANSPGGSGSLGPNAAANLRLLLESLANSGSSGVVLHGAGQHTLELVSFIAKSPVPILAITDDDPSRHGQSFLGWRILAPAAANESGASDLVISSFIHAESIWSRREIYERQGLRVHRMYPDGGNCR